MLNGDLAPLLVVEHRAFAQMFADEDLNPHIHRHGGEVNE